MFQQKKRKQEILKNYTQAKKSEFDFERIAMFFSSSDHKDSLQVIPYSTLQDLDFEELFMYMDRTCSKIGQQHLYSTLRTIPKDKSRSEQFEKTIKYINDNPNVKETSALELSRLSGHGSYFLHTLISGQHITKPRWFWIFPLFSTLSATTLLLSFFFPVIVPIFILIFSVNFIFHLWNKKNILTYSNTIPQLQILNQVAKRLLGNGAIQDDKREIQKAVDSIDSITRKSVFFIWESQINNEVGLLVEYFGDLLKAPFLLEPMLIFNIAGELELKKLEINKVFNAVAQVDVALSISSFRATLPYFTTPDIIEKKKTICAQEMFHPLIMKPVANSIDLSDGKSVLVSGSNMSGKTTFIRTIGINSILAQTINTVCARVFVAPKLRVHSAIRIADDLLDETSYYYEEVKRIKRMVEESESNDQNLFLLDELFKGTNTIERISSGKAVLSYLNRNKNLVFVSTHDIELTDLLGKTYRYYHFAESVENDLLVFDYQLRDGIAINTNAIKILEINEFPKQVTEEAKKLAKQIAESKRI